MPDGVVHELNSGLTGVDHETVGELHGLSTCGAEFSGDDDLATFRTRLHDETEDTIASTRNGYRKLIEERFGRRALTGGQQGHQGACNGGIRTGR